MAREPAKWFDRCVRLDGYVGGYTFFSGVAGHYRRFATDQEDHPNEGWLGLYFEDRREIQKPFGRISVVGIVDDCDRSYKAAAATAGPNEIIMPIGYCHYEGGLTLNHVRVISRTKGNFSRETGEAARRKFGDLEPPNDDHPIPAKAQTLVREFEQAFSANQSDKLMSLVYPYRSNLETAAGKRKYRAYLSGAVGPLRTFRRRGELPIPKWFYARQAQSEQTYAPFWFACYCRDDDCNGKWPIAELDTGSSSDLPYVCLRVFEDVNRNGLHLALDALDEPYGIGSR